MATEEKVTKVKVPFFKRWYTMLVIGFVVGGIAFSGGGSETTVTSGNKDSITSEVPATATPDEVEAVEEEVVEEEPVVEADPVVVWEDEMVTISFKEITDKGVKFLMENKTDRELTAQADSIAINGFSSNDITMSDAVAPMSKGYITVRTSELADAGTPETVSGKLRIIDFSGDWDTYDASFTNVSLK